MIGTVCLSSLLRHDVRLRRQLSGWEFRDFFDLLCLASEGRDPAYLPPKKVALLRQELGLQNDAQAAARLERFAALDLVEMQDDGGLLVTYLLEQEEDDAPPYPPQPAPQNSHSQNSNGQNGQSGGGQNGHGPNGVERRQTRRRYSNTPGAQRARDAYWRRQRAEGGAAGDDGESAENLTQNLTQNLTLPAENLTPRESKPNALALGFGPGAAPKPNAKPNAGREVSRARVGHSNTVSGDSKNFESSEYGTTVAPPQNLTPSAGNLTKPNAPRPAHSQGIPPPRPPLQPQEVPAARNRDVQAVMSVTGERRNFRNFWLSLWRHCHEAGRLDLWDQGFAIIQEAQRVRPPEGPGSVRRPAVYLKSTILTLLDRAGVAYQPKGDTAPPIQEVSAEEAADIQRMIAETKESWAAERGDRDLEAPDDGREGETSGD